VVTAYRTIPVLLSPSWLNAMRRRGATANHMYRTRKGALQLINGPAHSQHQAIPVHDPKRPSLGKEHSRVAPASA